MPIARGPVLAALLVMAVAPTADAEEAHGDPPTAAQPRVVAAAVATASASELTTAADPRIPLPEGQTRLGVTRRSVVSLFDGEQTAVPTVAVTDTGQLFAAAVVYDRQRDRERIWIASAPTLEAEFDRGRPVTPGSRAWRPRLAVGPEGEVWLAWCGQTSRSAKVPWQRTILARRVGPGRLGAVRQVSTVTGRACDPDLAIGPDGTLHVVWEEAELAHPEQTWIAYRALSASGRPRGPVERVSAGLFARRPAIAILDENTHVAWDSLVDSTPTGALDPDYDIFLRTRTEGRFADAIAVDVRDSIQAAPSLAPAPDGGVLVAYHSSHLHGLVKWWTVRRVRGKRVAALEVDDAAARLTPQGEQQGAEFPALASVGGRLFVATRPSQGSYLHLVEGQTAWSPLDLTRRPWGGRGMRTSLVAFEDGRTLVMARRARIGAEVERFSLPDSAIPTLRFTVVPRVAKAARQGGRFPPPVVGAVLGSEHAAAKIYFGDLHMHSAMTDGTGPPDEIYARAYVRGLDFAALTDHDDLIGRHLLPSMQDEIAWVTEAFNAREGFTTLHAYEWTTRPVPQGAGHRNVYFRGLRPAPLCASKGVCPDSDALFAKLKKSQVFAVPHHTGWTGTEWEWAGTAQQPLLEIVSVHGAFEARGNAPIAPRGDLEGMFAVDGIRRGRRFGFVGGSDAHGLLWHHGIGRKRDPWACGLAGVIAADSGRETLFDALSARRTFATSGAPLQALLRAGGIPMGEQGEANRPVQLTAAVRGVAPPAVATLVRDGDDLLSRRLDARETEIQWRDDQVSAGPHFYYLRVVQGDGADAEVAWSSPAFVSISVPPPDEVPPAGGTSNPASTGGAQ